ncbi:MAG: phosphatidylglycerophosphatase A [Spirochaetota bacterium]
MKEGFDSPGARIARLLYTGFYTGLVPVAPGTAGTVLALVLYMIVQTHAGRCGLFINMVVVLILLYPAILLGDHAERETGIKDPQVVVLDEMMGYWITMFMVPYSVSAAIAGFVLFRFFDILKPWPIRSLQRLKGGLGIMIDDYVAGVCACLILWGLYLTRSLTGITVV